MYIHRGGNFPEFLSWDAGLWRLHSDGDFTEAETSQRLTEAETGAVKGLTAPATELIASLPPNARLLRD